MGFFSDIAGAVGGLVGGPVGSIIGGLAGASSGSRSTSSGPSIPGWVSDQARLGFRGLNQAAGRTAAQAIAPLNYDQLASMQMIRDLVGAGQDDYLAATATAKDLAGGINAGDIREFYNPFEQDVVNSFIADANHGMALNDMQVNAEAEAAGAFGGDRQAVYDAVLDSNTARDMTGKIANLRLGGYNTAMQGALSNLGLRIGGNSQLQSLIDSRRNALFQDAQGVAGVGDALYGYDQRIRDYPVDMAREQINAASQFAGAQQSPRVGGGFGGALTGFLGGVRTAQQIGGALNPPAPQIIGWGHT